MTGHATDEGWALVDLLKNAIENVRDEPQFTVAEHALMAAGEIQRNWLAEHDAALIEVLAFEMNTTDGLNDPDIVPWLRKRARERRGGRDRDVA